MSKSELGIAACQADYRKHYRIREATPSELGRMDRSQLANYHAWSGVPFGQHDHTPAAVGLYRDGRMSLIGNTSPVVAVLRPWQPESAGLEESEGQDD